MANYILNYGKRFTESGGGRFIENLRELLIIIIFNSKTICLYDFALYLDISNYKFKNICI